MFLITLGSNVSGSSFCGSASASHRLISHRHARTARRSTCSSVYQSTISCVLSILDMRSTSTMPDVAPAAMTKRFGARLAALVRPPSISTSLASRIDPFPFSYPSSASSTSSLLSTLSSRKPRRRMSTAPSLQHLAPASLPTSPLVAQPENIECARDWAKPIRVVRLSVDFGAAAGRRGEHARKCTAVSLNDIISACAVPKVVVHGDEEVFGLLETIGNETKPLDLDAVKTINHQQPETRSPTHVCAESRPILCPSSSSLTTRDFDSTPDLLPAPTTPRGIVSTSTLARHTNERTLQDDNDPSLARKRALGALFDLIATECEREKANGWTARVSERVISCTLY